MTKKTTFVGGGNAYSAPEMEIISAVVEKGFQNSPYGDYGDFGMPGDEFETEDNGGF